MRNNIQKKFDAQKISKIEYLRSSKFIANEESDIRHSLADFALIETIVETIPQFLGLAAYLSFYDVNFYTPRGRYVYFYSIARSIVNSSNFGQLFLFYLSLIAAILTASIKLVQYSNVAAKESLTLIQKSAFAKP